MKRTKEWWNRLTKTERCILVSIERNSQGGMCGGMLPDDCSECSNCGQAMLGSGICHLCSKQWDDIINKANAQPPQEAPLSNGNSTEQENVEKANLQGEVGGRKGD